jgi:hypothetical protein
MSNFGLFSYVVVDPYHTPRLFVGEEQYTTFVELCQTPPLFCRDETLSVEMRGLEPLTSSVQGRRSPI